MTRNPRILAADDQRDVLTALRLLLKGEGFEVETVGSPAAVLETLPQGDFDAVVLDLNYGRDTTSGAEGLELVEQVRSLDRDLPIIVMTAWGTIELAVEAMRRGARDFIEKPWDNTRLIAQLRNHVELRRALRRSARLEAQNMLLAGADNEEQFIAQSPAMEPVLERVRRVAPADANVLITGEPGTGKGMVARLLHRMSSRAGQAMISVNMGSVPEGTFESEMFGHVKGAFTDARADRVGRFELADGGTLLLDEVGNIPPTQQGKLLRVLESGEFERVGSSRTQRADVRLLAATNDDLVAAIDAGRFRKDLYFRLNTVEIHLPPLRKRREDIIPLAMHYLARYRKHYRKSLEGFERTAGEALLDYHWPGNVRELSHVVEHAVLLAGGARLNVADLGLKSSNTPGKASAELPFMPLEDAERKLIRSALERTGRNVHRAARLLGLSRSAMYRRMEKYGL